MDKTPIKICQRVCVESEAVCVCVYVCVFMCVQRREVSYTAAAAPSDCAFLCALLQQESCICLTVPPSPPPPLPPPSPPAHSQLQTARPRRQFVNQPVRLLEMD